MTIHPKINVIPDCLSDIATQPRWVVWKWENRKNKQGITKPTKPPHRAAGGRVGGYASNDKPDTWVALETAQRAYATGQCEGIGLQLLGLQGFAAIDLDDVRDETGDYIPWAREAIEAAKSYSEHTPSGKGGRILGRVSGDFETIHTKLFHPEGGSFEVYANLTEGQGRYVTVTGDWIDGTPDALQDISAIIHKLMADAQPEEEEEGDAENKAGEIDTGFNLPGWAVTFLQHGGSGDRSGDFQSVVNAMRPRGWTFEAALKAFQDNPTGPASKYLEGDRLERELQRAWDKAKPPGSGEVKNEKPADLGDDPVDLWGSFPAPELPASLLPVEIEQFARVQGELMGADPARLAVAALVTCAAAITDYIRLQVKRHDPTWTESARIWAALVGSPSTKKSPILSAATAPLCRIDREMFRDWQAAMTEFDALSKEEKHGKRPPPQTRLRIEDATVEAAQMVLEGSPAGVMMLQDELSGFFGAMDKYNGGKGAAADRAFWLRSFNGGEFALNRVGRGSGLVPNLSLCLLGGIQPEPIRSIVSGAHDDGLLQRLFPIVLQPATMGTDAPAPPVVAIYQGLVSKLHALRAPGFPAEVLRFDDAAQDIRRSLEERHLSLQASEAVNRKLAAHVGKYDGLFCRLCIIWHCIENRERGLPLTVTERTAERVGAFLHKFLLPHAVAFYGGILGLSDDHDRLQSIAGHILAHKLDRITNRDVQRGDRTMRQIREGDIRPLLEQLAALGWLGRIDGPRPSSQPHWIVNPAVHRRFADRAAQESTRREAARKSIAGMLGGQNE